MSVLIPTCRDEFPLAEREEYTLAENWLASTPTTNALVPRAHPRKYPQNDLPLMMLARPAHKARKLHPVSASRAACRRRRRNQRRMLRKRVVPIQAASPIGNRAHNAAADAQPRRDLAMRQRALVDQGIDFIDKRDRQHVDKTLSGELRIWGFGRRIAGSKSVWKPEVAVLRQGIAIVVEDEGVPSGVVGILEVAFVEVVFIGLQPGVERLPVVIRLSVVVSAFQFVVARA
jgi:hypothetical protein